MKKNILHLGKFSGIITEGKHITQIDISVVLWGEGETNKQTKTKSFPVEETQFQR